MLPPNGRARCRPARNAPRRRWRPTAFADRCRSRGTRHRRNPWRRAGRWSPAEGGANRCVLQRLPRHRPLHPRCRRGPPAWRRRCAGRGCGSHAGAPPNEHRAVVESSSGPPASAARPSPAHRPGSEGRSEQRRICGLLGRGQSPAWWCTPRRRGRRLRAVAHPAAWLPRRLRGGCTSPRRLRWRLRR